ncbi:hypothetical protein JCM11251_002482 [Rhodosporidiobolus azoricus]
MAIDPPLPRSSTHPRLDSLTSPKQHKHLGSVGGRAGPGFSPYARRVASRAALERDGAAQGEDEHDHRQGRDLDDEEQEGSNNGSPSQARQSSGLFGKVRSLPGRLLGALTRSSSSRTLSSSTSLADVRAQVERDQQQEDAEAGKGAAVGGMSRSKTAHNLAGAAAKRLQASVGHRGGGGMGAAGGLTSSSSLSALSSYGTSPAFPPAPGRSAHSTLTLPPHSASTTHSTPSFLSPGVRPSRSRAVSPALSSASLLGAGSGPGTNSRLRSPSPLRNGLAGSMSSFNLASQLPPSPTSASQYGGSASGRGLPSSYSFNPTLGNNAISNPFGLTSRSPFSTTGSRRRVAGSPTSSVGGRSVSSSYATGAGSGPGAGHPLFPYASPLPRGQTPSLSLSGSQSMREGLATAGSVSGRASSSLLGTKRPRGSPLNPSFPASASVAGNLSSYGLGGAARDGEGEDLEMLGGSGSGSGAERARKKQMVWDPVRGLVSRERLEREKEREAPALPKNEAERILEVLEGMGRTPVGEAKRGASRPKVNVPLSASTASRTAPSTLPASSSSTPYAARAPRSSTEPAFASSSVPNGAPEKGLQAVLRAREARRRALLEQEREERERERREAEDRERRRVRRRRELRALEQDGDEGMGSDEELDRRALEEDEEMDREEVVSPRRSTRSSARQQQQQQSAKNTTAKKDRLEAPAPTPRRSTRASSSRVASKSPSPAPPAKKARGKGKSAAPVEEDEEQDAPMSPPAKKTAKSPSPAPPAPSATSTSIPPVPKITFPAPSSFPSTSTPLPSGRSSLRPGKSHSSRQHQASSKVFSAREEDLPPVDEEALGKMAMAPAFSIPAGFSFGAPAAKDGEKKKDEVPAAAAAASSSSLLSRLGAPPPVTSTSTTESTKPAFSFGAPSAAATSEKKDALAAPSAAAKSDFFAKPSTTSTAPAAGGFSFATPLATSTPPAKPSFGSSTDGGKPNFFGAVLADKKDTAAVVPAAPVPSFSFGAPAVSAASEKEKKDEQVIKPTEIVTPAEEKKESAPASSAPAANPFAAFGKPVAELIKESSAGGAVEEKKDEGEKKEAEKETPKFAFAFSAPAQDKKEEKKDATPAPSASPFSFGTPASKPADAASPAPTASPFTFGAAAAKPASSSPAPAFSFGTPAASPAPVSAAPTFTFGTTPATPKADEEKKDATPAAPALTFGLSPSKPASVVDDAGDSGMEDEADEPAAVAKPAAPSLSFNFGAPAATSGSSPFGAPASSATSPAPFAFGAPAAAADKKEASPAPSFGGATSASSSGLFGAPANKPAFAFGSPSPSPAPPSPAATAPSFTFGQPSITPAAPAAASPFAFGAPSSAAPAFGAASAASAAPASPAVPSFSFGQPTASGAVTPTTAPASPGPAAFNFGAPSSSAMGQSLSAASTGSFTFGASQPATPAAATSGGFSFGAPATTGAVGGPSGAAAFTFGAPAASPAAPAAGASGFNFGAPAAASPATPGGVGMFNIGSGGADETPKTGPGGRQIRPLRKPRR